MDNNFAGLTWQNILPSLMAQVSGAGQLRMVEVESVGDYFDCNAKVITLETLFRALIGVDTAGKPAIRVSFESTETADFADCNNKSTNVFQNIKGCIGVDAEGNPCVRILLDSL